MVKILADCRSNYKNAGADLLSNVFGKTARTLESESFGHRIFSAPFTFAFEAGENFYLLPNLSGKQKTDRTAHEIFFAFSLCRGNEGRRLRRPNRRRGAPFSWGQWVLRDLAQPVDDSL